MKPRWNQLLGITGCLFALALASVAKEAARSKLDYGSIAKPDFFPILPWDPYHGWGSALPENPPKTATSGLESIAECHFNMAGFVLPKDLKLCQKLGLGAIMLPTDAAFTNFPYMTEWKKLSDQEIEQRVKRMVDAAGSNRAVMGYFITDEPGALDFPALAKAVAAVKKYAPGKLAYINLFPDYATLGANDISQLGTTTYHEYLERFVSEVQPQMLSYDNYMVEDSMDLENRGLAASYYRNLLEIRRVAQEHNLPYLNIVSANQLRPHTTIPSPANLAFQAFTTLAAGYRGVTWYTYYTRGYHYASIDDAGKKTQIWAYLAEVNRQMAALAPVMSRLKSTGVFFTSPGPVDGMPLLPGSLVESAACATPLMIGEFEHQDGHRYLMVVNLSLKASTKFTLKLKQAQECVQTVSTMDGSLGMFDQKNGLWLTAGQGVLLKLGK
jgi:hypothetical protein